MILKILIALMVMIPGLPFAASGGDGLEDFSTPQGKRSRHTPPRASSSVSSPTPLSLLDLPDEILITILQHVLEQAWRTDGKHGSEPIVYPASYKTLTQVCQRFHNLLTTPNSLKHIVIPMNCHEHTNPILNEQRYLKRLWFNSGTPDQHLFITRQLCLKELVFMDLNITPDTVKAIIPLLGKMAVAEEGADQKETQPTLEKLIFSESTFSNFKGFVSLCQAMGQSETLVYLRIDTIDTIDRWPLRAEDVFLSHLQPNATLQTLIFNNSVINDQDAQKLATILEHNKHLTTLQLSDHWLEDSAIAILAEPLKHNTTLSTLDLSVNKMGTEYIQSLSDMLTVNTGLITLNLRESQIQDSWIRPLAAALKTNRTLKVLNLSENYLDEYATRDLAQALEINTTLTTLNLSHNHLYDHHIDPLVDMLKTNTTLTTLDVSANRLESPGQRFLKEAFEERGIPGNLILLRNSQKF